MTLPDFDKIIYKVIGTRITQIEDTLQITEIQLNTVYNLIKQEYDKEWADLFYIHLRKDQLVAKKKKEWFVNIQKCQNCKYLQTVYDDCMQPLFLRCSNQYSNTLDLIKPYCIKLR